MLGAHIENRMESIQPERIDVIFPKPIECIFYEKVTHRITIRPIEIHRLAPRRLVFVREIGSKVPQIISFRP